MSCSKDFVERALSLHGKSVYQLAIARTLSIQDAQDVFQEVFLSLVRAGEARFTSDEHVKAWLLRATCNACAGLARSSRHPRILSFEELGVELPSNETHDQDSASAGEVWALVQALPPALREVVHLRYVEELSCAEIASITRVSEVVVRGRLHRAKAKLRKLMAEGEGRHGTF